MIFKVMIFKVVFFRVVSDLLARSFQGLGPPCPQGEGQSGLRVSREFLDTRRPSHRLQDLADGQQHILADLQPRLLPVGGQLRVALPHLLAQPLLLLPFPLELGFVNFF